MDELHKSSRLAHRSLLPPQTRTVQISDFEVPEPCKVVLAYGQDYYVPLVSTAGAALRTWDGDKHDTYALKSKLVHLDFQSAEIHAKALIEVSKGWWK